MIAKHAHAKPWAWHPKDVDDLGHAHAKLWAWHPRAQTCPRKAVGMAPALSHAHAKPWAWHPREVDDLGHAHAKPWAWHPCARFRLDIARTDAILSPLQELGEGSP